ncbi:MAG TPA: SDR family oxidoreductase [Steroidobacteraceae bacterium]|nr:SDR family oxidoreductase [Steroidobacteraceae bacterium]
MIGQAGQFAGRIAVVTGGASGIGRACVEVLAERGARVVIVDSNEPGALAVARALGGEARVADVSDPAQMVRLADGIENEIGPVDMVVANAGIIQSTPAMPEELDLATWDTIMAVDLRGAYLTNAQFARHMTKRGRGSIVNIASVAGMRSAPLHAYGAAKAGVIHMTTTLAAEWGRSGIRVNAVSPGYVLTPILQEAIARGLRDPKVMEENSALGRMVMPIEIAKSVAFLLSDDASAITGINLPVENGWLVTGSWHTYGGIRGPRRRFDR